ncbi:MAG: AI-2E family transporter [Deltaproteobacteria bacterium]|nr:AI-2E family transporter [Deltaproteobacteria bacterium]
MTEKTASYTILLFFLACFLISIFLLGWLLWPFLSIIILAAVVSGIFSPLYGRISGSGIVRPAIASFLTCCVIFCILFVPIVFFVSILSKEAYDLYLAAKDAMISPQIMALMEGSKVLEITNNVLTNFNFQITVEELNTYISEIAKFVGLFLYNQARSIASNMLEFFINFFLMLLVIYYLLIDGGRLVSFIIDLSPLPNNQDQILLKKFKDMAGAILIGNGAGGLIQGLAGGIVFSIFGLPSPFLWGVIMGLLAFLPIIGIGIVFIPAAMYLFLKGRIASGIFFIVFYVVLSGGVEYFFKPKLVGQRVKMHTLLVFLAIIGGLKLFGVLGIIYGPLVITAFLTLTDIYRTNYQTMVNPLGIPLEGTCASESHESNTTEM